MISIPISKALGGQAGPGFSGSGSFGGGGGGGFTGGPGGAAFDGGSGGTSFLTDAFVNTIFTAGNLRDADPVFGLNSFVTIELIAPAEVPLPAAAWVFLAGLGGLGAAQRRKRANTR